MTEDLSTLIEEAESMARQEQYEAAISLADELVTKYPDEVRVWSLRAYLHRRKHDYAEAASDLTQAIKINENRPEGEFKKNVLTTIDLFINRGADRFALGDNQSSINDFTRGLDLCELYASNDYRETLLFWRAEALLKLGRKKEALSDLAQVPDDFRFWTDKLRTKDDLLADCAKLYG